jgi:DNA primase
MAVKIESIAEQLTELRGGSTLTGACPFHGGSGTELVIWTDIEEWKCYGRCQMGGDVIHFIQECDKRGLKWV